MSLRSDHHLDALALSQLDRDDTWARVRPRPGRNLGYLFDELRLARRQGDWQLAVVARQRAVAMASEGALDLARVAQASGAPSSDQRWAVALDYQGFSGAGLELGRQLSLGEQWRLALAVQGLALARVTERQVNGTASYAVGTAEYRADLRSTEADDGLRFPFQQPQAARGAALLAHGSLTWQGGPWQGGLRWRDAGVLHWRGLPQQQLALSTDIRSVDAQGYVVYAPLVVGQNSQPHYRRWLRPLTSLEGSWHDAYWGRWTLAADWWPGWGGALPRGQWQRRVAGVDLALGWRMHERRAEIGLGWRDWRLLYGVSGPGAVNSRSVGIGWGRPIEGP